MSMEIYEGVHVNKPELPRVELAAMLVQDGCHSRALLAGWWTNKDGTRVQDDKYAFSNKLMLTVSELGEAMEGDRKNLKDDHLPQYDMRAVELADAVIRIFDMAGAFGYNLGEIMAAKLAYNEQRPDHKAEARAAEGGKAY